MRPRHHYIMAGVTLLLSIVCAVLIFHVNVNSDMTKYLPDSSQMKKGIALMDEEFSGSAEMTGADVKVMFHFLEDCRKQQVADSLSMIPDVLGVDFRTDESGEYTLYELNVPKSVDQKTMGLDIRKNFGKDVVVSTSQDGATPPASVMIIAASLILFILLLMAQSWLDPFIFIITTGLAVVLNIGTNALLPSVSITTNYIVAILQMVLSLDYSIVLMNRYRQEKNPMRTPAMAANVAIKRAYPSILSSALTTIVGLLMLVFMRLKIGMDMGVVLAKGVVCSLICTFTLLPTLMMLFHRGVMNTGKKTFVLPTDRLSRFATRYKIPLLIFALALFVTSFFFSRRTEIVFSTNTESEIDKVFPAVNPVVVLYDTEDEMEVLNLADTLRRMECVQAVISYPTLLKQDYTADEMTTQLHRMTKQFADYIPEGTDLSILTPELMRIVYYMNKHDNPGKKLTFRELAEFISSDCVDNPMFSAYMDEGMKEKLALMNSMTGFGEEQQEEEPVQEVTTPQPQVIVSVSQSQAAVTSKKDDPVKDAPIVVVRTAPEHNSGNIPVVSFMPKLYAAQADEQTAILRDLSDTASLRRKMTAAQMGAFIGSTPAQTKMVYSFSKASSKTMTPMEYVHFLNDDLFNRKALSAMVSAEQKRGLRVRMKVMDYADADMRLSASDMVALLSEFGVTGITEDRVMAIAYPKKQSQDPTGQSAVSRPSVTAPEEKPLQPDSLVVVDSSKVIAPVPAPVPAKPKKTLAEQRQELFMYLVNTDKAFTSAQMALYFKRLGEKIDPATVSLLYTYYGSVKEYDESDTMNIEELLNFVSDTLSKDDRLTQFIPEDALSGLSGVRTQLDEGIGMMRNDNHSLLVVMTDLPVESDQTYEFISALNDEATGILSHDYYTVGESVMYDEMKKGFGREMTLVTLLTVIAIFLIIAISFRSFIVPLILVMTVMTAVYVNVVFSGVFSGHMLYLAYLIVQSILMGATIDYGILFANYYKEKRKTMPIPEAVQQAYRGSIRTIMTSGLIMVLAPGAMSAMIVDDLTISAIVGSLAIGAFVAVLLILVVVPGLLAAFDRWVVHGRVYGRNRK